MRAETPAGVDAEKFIEAVAARLPEAADVAPAEKPISAWVLVAANALGGEAPHGGAAAMALGSPLWALLVLLGVKIAVDLTAHLKEHRS